MVSLLVKARFLQNINRHSFVRTFLSPAYYCREIWDSRLGSPILQKVNLDLLYHELDQRFQKTRQISAVDVDIFANASKDDVFIDELMDLVHKLRLSADTINTLESTPHAVIRTLMAHEKFSELVQALDDRLNYGLFLDDYTANLLMDVFWKRKDFTSGARIAQQVMLQEDFSHPLTTAFAILHCYNYLLKPEEWPKVDKPPEPEEEVKVRVKYLRNPFNDYHFDLEEPLRIVGKTLAMATKNRQDDLGKSINEIGSDLFNGKDISEIELRPEIGKELEKQVQDQVAATAERDIANQCEALARWEGSRNQALEEQRRQLNVAKRLADIEELKNNLMKKEQKLWFFENEEQIELQIEAKQAELKTDSSAKKSKSKIDEEYVPPEITVNRVNK